ncbi:interferon-induced, double-stranded RNA-activated protein kinase isoform X1 [Acipenser ruthenus]|uniref:interferon-induced, double-stranded RNA-activated protein kinase isoform X1 n=1 Tax=Acipenser ruthenus TaxID=7906 RepID=UPI002741870A|nr:interferon-induced, double-stranded RNA-activated protein kinase isoform X1 [Acipenser ruthenus]XP_058881428.1 interferon-induced, double-stranded RNA-activated protein kinase isoform X1 [Acipenser ruthenus]
MAGQNYIGDLNEYRQKNNVTLVFQEVSRNGPAHNRTFTFKVIVDNVEYPEATGKTKKEAKKNAAKEALEIIRGQSNTSNDMATSTPNPTPQTPPPQSTSTPNPAPQATPPQTSDRRESCTSQSVPSNLINYVACLNEYGHQKDLVIRLVESNHVGPAHLPQFSCKYKIGEREFREGKGKNKKEAKKEAARLAYEELHLEENAQTSGQKDSVSGLDSSGSYSSSGATPVLESQTNDTSTSKQVDSSQTEGSFNGTNYIVKLNEYCQKRSKMHDFRCVRQEGPSHNPVYYYQVMIEKRTFPEGQGKSAKEAKQRAAQLAMEALSSDPKPSSQEIVEQSPGGARLKNSATPVLESQTNGTSTSKQVDSSQTEGSINGTNYIGKLNEYCQKRSEMHDFKRVRQEGSSHDPLYYYQVMIEKRMFPEGQGKSAKEAKQRAAQLAMEALASDPKPSSQEIVEQSPGGARFKNRKVNLAPDFKNDLKSTPNKNDQDNIVPNLNKDRHLGKNVSERTNSNNLQNSRLFQEFDEITKLGEGGFGSVFKARKILDRNFYAVKLVKYKNNADREVAALARLEHDNIVRYSTSWVEELAGNLPETSESYSSSDSDPSALQNYLFIQMKLYEKGTLENWINDKNDLKTVRSKTDALQIFKQMVDGVVYIHSNNLIHRDLKPTNIFLSDDNKVKIGDFGLATAIINENNGNSLQRTTRTGTLSYMSPEQETQNKYGNEVDIFALGLICFELLWRLETVSEKASVWDQIRRREFPEVFCTEYRSESKLIEKMLSEAPKDRPKASKIAKDLNMYFKKEDDYKESKTV